MGKSIHAGQVVVADGTDLAAERIRRVLTADPGMGVVRHADAGYPEAIDAAGAAACTCRCSTRSRRRDRRDRAAPPQVLRPPEDGLPYLRHDRAGELTAEPGRPGDRGRRIAGFEDDAGAAARIDATGCARPARASSTATRTCRSPAGGRASTSMKVTGVPYEEIARAGGGIRSSARRSPKATDDEVLAQAARRSPREMLEHGTTTFECKSGYGLSVDGGAARAAARRASSPRGRAGHDVDRAARPRRPRRLRRRRLDGRGRGARCPRVHGRRRRARHLRRVDRLQQRRTCAAWASSRAAHGLDLRAHVEQFNANRSVPVALELARARSTTSSRCTPTTSARSPPPSAPPCCCPAPRCMGDEHTPPARALADAGAIGVLATDATPARRRSSRCR